MLVALPERIELYGNDGWNHWRLEHTFDAYEVFRNYDPSYGENPVFESYLATLVESWLSDIGYGWSGKIPPGLDVFEQLDLVGVLHDGSISAGARL